MSTTALYKLSSIVLPGGTLAQIVEDDFAPGLIEAVETNSGSVDPSFAAIMEGKPAFSFTTTALASALTYAGLTPLAIAAETDLYFARLASGGTIDSGTTHIKLSLSAGILVPKMIEASQGREPAHISYDLYALSSDGLTNPITLTTGQALPSQGNVAELFTLGPCEFNTTPLTAGQSLRWDFGMNCQVVGSDGEPWPTYAAVDARRPGATLRGLDASALNVSGTAGLALTSFATYFRKVAKGGTRVPNATASHIKLSGTTGMLVPTGIRGSAQRPLDAEFQLIPTYDGTNNIVAISTASAIT